MATEKIIMGFAGAAKLGTAQVLVSSGNFNREKNYSYMNMMEMRRDNVSRTKVTFSSGTWGISGSLSFDLTDTFLDVLTSSLFLKRGYQFDLILFDGVNKYKLANCYYTNLSLSSSANSLVTCSINVISKEDFAADTSTTFTMVKNTVPIAYWETGNTNIKDWTLSIDQEVTPIYCNEDSVYPRYLRYGLWNANLDVTTYNQIEEHDTVEIKTKLFKINGNSGTVGYTYGGMNDVGLFAHHFESASPDPDTGSAVKIFTLS